MGLAQSIASAVLTTMWVARIWAMLKIYVRDDGVFWKIGTFQAAAPTLQRKDFPGSAGRRA